MEVHSEIQINKFQLGVLLTGLDKKFYDCIIENNIYCTHCKQNAIKGILVDTIYITKLNDLKVFGRCKVCNSEVARLFVFGKEKVFGVKANKLRESIKELTLLDV